MGDTTVNTVSTVSTIFDDVQVVVKFLEEHQAAIQSIAAAFSSGNKLAGLMALAKLL